MLRCSQANMEFSRFWVTSSMCGSHCDVSMDYMICGAKGSCFICTLKNAGGLEWVLHGPEGCSVVSLKKNAGGRNECRLGQHLSP